MAYVKYTWQNLPNITTPISKANLDHLETQYEEFTKLYDADTILVANANDTPIILTVAANRIVGRAAGAFAALTGAEILTIAGWTNAKLLLGAGAGIAPTEIDVPANPTKEFFVPVTFGTEMIFYGRYPVARCNAATDYGVIAFRIPHDYTAITTAEIVVICRATQAAADWDIFSNYAAVGQTFQTHAEQDVGSTYNVTNDEIEVVDISGELSAIAVDDYVGVSLVQAGAGDNVDILGVHFKYS